MSVKKYKLNRDDLNEQSAINIPLDLDFQPVDNSEIIERKFIEENIEEAINPIIDYEQYRFIPAYEDEEGINQIKILNYKLHFLNSNGDHTVGTTTYEQIDFEQNDLKFRKNYFKNSFLTLSFYDSDVSSDQNLLTFSNLFCNLKVPANDGDLSSADIKDNNTVRDINQIPVEFELTNPKLLNERIHEGFNLYWYKNELPQELYMRATFNNAKNGQFTEFMTIDGSPSIDQFVNELHTRYSLREGNDYYYYVLDTSYNNNISVSNLPSGHKKIDIHLYEVKVS